MNGNERAIDRGILGVVRKGLKGMGHNGKYSGSAGIMGTRMEEKGNVACGFAGT